MEGFRKRQPMVFPVRTELRVMPYEAGQSLSGLRMLDSAYR